MREIYNKYQSISKLKRKTKKFKEALVHYGLLEHGNKKEDIKKTQQKKRVLHMRRCIDYLNGCVTDDIDLRQNYFKQVYRRNPGSLSCVLPKLEHLWISKQKILNEHIVDDVEYGTKIAMIGVINCWTQTQWLKFNNAV